MYKFFIFFLLTTCYLLFTSGVLAQQLTTGIFPPAVEVVVSPGHDFDLTFILQNKADPAIYALKVVPFGGSGKGAFEYMIDDVKLQDYQAFFLATGQKKQINLHVRVPKQAAAGDYYLEFVAQTQPAPQEDESQALIATGVSSKILVTVSSDGSLDVSPKLDSFILEAVQKLSFFGHDFYLIDEGTAIPAVVMATNRGRNFFHAQGTLSVNGIFGQVASFDIPQQIVLAGSGTIIRAKDAGVGSTAIISSLWPGFYTASTSLNFGPGTPAVFAHTTFVIFPFKLIGTVLIGLILLASYKRYKK